MRFFLIFMLFYGGLTFKAMFAIEAQLLVDSPPQPHVDNWPYALTGTTTQAPSKTEVSSTAGWIGGPLGTLILWILIFCCCKYYCCPRWRRREVHLVGGGNNTTIVNNSAPAPAPAATTVVTVVAPAPAPAYYGFQPYGYPVPLSGQYMPMQGTGSAPQSGQYMPVPCPAPPQEPSPMGFVPQSNPPAYQKHGEY